MHQWLVWLRRLEVEPRHAVHTEAERDLAAMVKIVFEQVPHDPLSGPRRSLPGLVGLGSDELLRKIATS